jgi:hypothetical protein
MIASKNLARLVILNGEGRKMSPYADFYLEEVCRQQSQALCV